MKNTALGITEDTQKSGKTPLNGCFSVVFYNLSYNRRKIPNTLLFTGIYMYIANKKEVIHMCCNNWGWGPWGGGWGGGCGCGWGRGWGGGWGGCGCGCGFRRGCWW
jgi:hypothetical protein